MKKFWITIICTVLIFSTYSCNKKLPLEPAYPTPNVTKTAAAIATQTEVAALVSVPGGTFTQTDETGTNSFNHTISAFKMGKYQVTYKLWFTIYQWAIINGYFFANTGVEGSLGVVGTVPTSAQYQPVTTINWRSVIVWCNAYSQMTGLIPVYYSDAGFTTTIKDSTTALCDNPYVNWSANGYRLPTEGEWQYAASYIDGSSWTPYNYASGAVADYTNMAATGDVAWHSYNSGNVTHDVGSKIANALSIYDMSGNVWEWCWDWNGTYPTGTVTDYRGISNGNSRVVRGGSYCFSDGFLQVGLRNVILPYYAFSYTGFRFVRTY